MSMKLILSALLLMSLSTVNNGLPVESNVECSHAADILFIVDTSSSIWPGYYGNIKTFLKDVIKTFKIGPDVLDSRVGLLTFSTREHLEFNLNRYKTVEDVLKAVDNMRFRGGDTYTHRALEFASKMMLTQQHGARDDVKKVVVVLTDGKSADSKKTAESAVAIKNIGADVFAIGVGKAVDFQELNAMASKPTEQFVFPVADYRALDSIKNIFAQTTCQVLTSTTISPITTVKPTTTSTAAPTTASTTTTTTAAPTTASTTTTTTAAPTTASTTTTTTTVPTTSTTTKTTTTTRPTTKRTTKNPVITTTELAPGDQPDFIPECKGKPADIYFLLDASSSVWIGHFHDRVLSFVRDLLLSFHISPLHTRVGLVTYSSNVNHEFGLSEYENINALLAAIQPEHIEYLTGGTNTGDAIKYVTEKGFGAGDARKGVAQIIITVTDGLSQEPKKTAQAAAEARRKGVYMFAIGVGPEVDAQELSDISSDPDEDFVFSVDDFKALSSVTTLLALKTCEAVSRIPGDDTNKPQELAKCSSMASNIVFAYDNFHSMVSSKVIVQDLITDFINDIAVFASHFKVGILTQPCTVGSSWLQSVSETQKYVASMRTTYTLGYPDIVRQLRTEMFNSVPYTERRVAVLVIDDMTGDLEQLKKEVKLLQIRNTKIIIVAVGKVEEAYLEQLVSKPLRDSVLRVDSYSQMRDARLDVLSMLCDRSSGVPVMFLETDGEDEYSSENVHNMNGQAFVDENQKEDSNEDAYLTNIISVHGQVSDAETKEDIDESMTHRLSTDNYDHIYYEPR